MLEHSFSHRVSLDLHVNLSVTSPVAGAAHQSHTLARNCFQTLPSGLMSRDARAGLQPPPPCHSLGSLGSSKGWWPHCPSGTKPESRVAGVTREGGRGGILALWPLVAGAGSQAVWDIWGSAFQGRGSCHFPQSLQRPFGVQRGPGVRT